MRGTSTRRQTVAKSSEAQIADIGRELSALVEGATRDIGRSLIAELPAVTPRDTGFTAANWRASRGAPVTAAVGSRSNVGARRLRRTQAAARLRVSSSPTARCMLRTRCRMPKLSTAARVLRNRKASCNAQLPKRPRVRRRRRRCAARWRGGAVGDGGGEPLPGLLAIRSGAEG